MNCKSKNTREETTHGYSCYYDFFSIYHVLQAKFLENKILFFLLTRERTCDIISPTKQERSFYTYVVSLPSERIVHYESEQTSLAKRYERS